MSHQQADGAESLGSGRHCQGGECREKEEVSGLITGPSTFRSQVPSSGCRACTHHVLHKLRIHSVSELEFQSTRIIHSLSLSHPASPSLSFCLLLSSLSCVKRIGSTQAPQPHLGILASLATAPDKTSDDPVN